MSENDFQIALTPEALDTGPDCEKAAFGLLEIRVAGRLLTALVENAGRDGNYRRGPYVSGYHLAEWLTWNWWRLRWEPCPTTVGLPPFDWDLSHRLSDIGEGYVWPNITVSSDGFQCELKSEPSPEASGLHFSYIGAPRTLIPATDFECAVDRFLSWVLRRLDDAGLSETNLQNLWQDLTVERRDPELARFRRIEALLGFDPDEAEAERIESCLKDADALGENSLAELATGAAKSMLSAREITEATAAVGFAVNSDDAFRLRSPVNMQWGQVAAWRIGAATAQAVRRQTGLVDQPVSNALLAEMAGMSEKLFHSDLCTNSLSWVFQPERNSARVALRGKWKAARRFDLARLLGDRLFGESSFLSWEPFSPATRAYSYRQKAQRRFAAELLSPWATVRGMLGNDYSEENREYVAEHFDVSERVISTLLVNNETNNRDPDGEYLPD